MAASLKLECEKKGVVFQRGSSAWGEVMGNKGIPEIYNRFF